MANPKVYITYHKPSHLVEDDDAFVPIQVGSAASIPGIACRDNSGPNISAKNASYCELTALYWIWKSAPRDLSHLGLLHYRRFLDFNDGGWELDSWGVVAEPCFTHDFKERFGIQSNTLKTATEAADVIVPRLWDVRSGGFRNLRHHYMASPHHHAEDLDICGEVLCTRHPEMERSWQTLLRSSTGYFNNMFVLRRDLFDAYCDWLFPIMEAIEPRIPIESYDVQSRRVMGYLSERLFNVWLVQLCKQQPQLRVRELDRVFVMDTSPRDWDPTPTPRSPDGRSMISTVVASDNHYVPHLGALIASIHDNLSPDYGLDLLILDGGITAANRRLLRRLIPTTSSISFVPMMGEFRSNFVHMHFSRSTFYRLVLHRLLQSRDKVIYLDCDTIVLGDLSELWEMDLQNHPIAAVPDYIMEAFCRGNTLSADFTGSLPASRYLRQFLSIDHVAADSYFQAGLLVMDLATLREHDVSAEMLNDLLKVRFWFLDQDILNKYFANDYLPLGCEWNYVNCGDSIFERLPDESRRVISSTIETIKMIHYAGYEVKPWVNPKAWLSEYYFYYLRQTFWYEQVMEVHRQPATSSALSPPARRSRRLAETAMKLWRRLPYQARMILNPLAYKLVRYVRQPAR